MAEDENRNSNHSLQSTISSDRQENVAQQHAKKYNLVEATESANKVKARHGSSRKGDCKSTSIPKDNSQSRECQVDDQDTEVH